MQETVVKQESKTARFLKLLLKIAITVVCFWYISRKIDFGAVKNLLLKTNWLWLIIAIALLMLSKFFSAIRLNIYFRNINLRLPSWNNIKLYWLGMFYNLFLPGSISGDAYKVVMLNKKFKAPYKKTSAAVLLDRFSGLLGLGVILSVYGVMVINNATIDSLLIAGCLFAIAILYIIIKKFFKDFVPGFAPTFFWGLIVQAIQVAGLYFILSSLHIDANRQQWIFIFLSASVISVLPVSLGGGLGTREFVFVTGANFFHLDAHV